MKQGRSNGKNGSVDDCVEIGLFAKRVIIGMEPGQTYTVLDLMQMADGPYKRGSTQQRFGHEVMPELVHSGAIEQTGRKPTVYAVTNYGMTFKRT